MSVIFKESDGSFLCFYPGKEDMMTNQVAVFRHDFLSLLKKRVDYSFDMPRIFCLGV